MDGKEEEVIVRGDIILSVDFVAARLEGIPPYLFAELDRSKRKAEDSGLELIDFGVGDPDLPTPPSVIDRLCQAARDPANHRYPSYHGMVELRTAVATWYERRFRVNLDPETEVLVLIGAKEGIAHAFWALVNPGDWVLLPDPCFPMYRAQTHLCGGIPHSLPLLRENNWLPDLDSLKGEVAEKAKLLVLNYPNNPTGAVAPLEFFQAAVDFARKYGMAIFNDAVYAEIAFDGYRPVSIFEVEGAKDFALEFYSLSKTYSMTGWRIGFCLGNRDLISALLKVKQNVDSGVPLAIQYAGVEALTGPQESVESLRRTYQERRDLLADGLRELGWEVALPKATFYLWVQTPSGQSSLEFAKSLIERARVLVAPGIGFGEFGEGWVRFALTVGKEKIQEAIRRLELL